MAAALDIGKRVRRLFPDTKSVVLPGWDWELQEDEMDVEGT